MKISYINGLCVQHDAISNAIQDEINWLLQDGNEVRLFAYDCCSHDIDHIKVDAISDVVFDPYFQTSELVVFHFGIFYPLFDLLPVCPKNARRVVVFHNITPKEFVPPENHLTIDKSFQQMANIMFADHVVCVSEVNQSVLQEAGITVPSTVLPLTVQGVMRPPETKPGIQDGIVRIAFVGRFVRSKGPDELLSAVESTLQQVESLRLQVDMIGNLTFSDRVMVDKVQKIAERIMQLFGDRVRVVIHGNAADEQKQEVLRQADLFVLPTYHEGFCVPIVEALASGCRVITYENSNTPFITGGFAELVPTGDVEKLSDSILKKIQTVLAERHGQDGTDGYKDYAERAAQYVQQFSPDQAKVRFLDFINTFGNRK